MRELAHGGGIVASRRPAPWVWSRVGGDALDLALLGVVLARNRRARTALAIANVMAVAAPDVTESIRLARRRNVAEPGKRIRKAVTLARSRTEVEAAWLGAVELRRKIEEADASVSFTDAPADRGIELAVEWLDAPPADDFGRIAAKLSGRDLATQLADADLGRRARGARDPRRRRRRSAALARHAGKQLAPSGGGGGLPPAPSSTRRPRGRT